MAENTSRRWVKVWHEVLTDESFQNFSLTQQARFYNLLVYVSAHGSKGEVNINAPARVLVNLLQCDSFDDMVNKIEQITRQNKNLKIERTCNDDNSVTYSVKFQKWHKYQVDDSSERVAKFRRNVTVQEKEKEEEKDKEKEGDPNVRIFIGYAMKSFNKQTGKKLCVDGGKDGSIVKKLLSTYGLDELKGLWEVFMRTTDPFVTEQAGFSIGVFKSQINKLMLVKPKKDWRA